MARGKRGAPNLIGTFDFETDPFAPGTTVKPFAVGFFDGTIYRHHWGDDAIQAIVAMLKEVEEPTIVYAHNGGKFDFTFLTPYIESSVFVIGSRLVKCKIGNVELRDSYSILPVKLGKLGGKREIDINKLAVGVRDRHRAEILEYMKDDCLALHGHVMAYRQRFGDAVTMASAAIAKLDEIVEQETGEEARDVLQSLPLHHDTLLRQFYFGGRVECMESGVLKGDWRVYDMNSMYPYVMKNYTHPVSNYFVAGRSTPEECDFAIIDATSNKAFPFRQPDGRLSFPQGRGMFKVTGHELRTALELKLCVIHKMDACVEFIDKRDFSSFVDTYYDLRMKAQADNDKSASDHWKLVLNSAYGRFALDPEKLRNWVVLPNGDEPPEIGWKRDASNDTHTFWYEPVSEYKKIKSVRNVATGASITGAARSELLRAIHGSERAVYCDTDSVFCRSTSLSLGSDLGQWKLDGEGDELAIAGKKTYALFKDGEGVKQASKGVRLTAEQIRRVALGDVIEWQSQSPTIDKAGQQSYKKRKVRRTV